MGNIFLLSAAANQQREDQASRGTVARRPIRRHVADPTTAKAIASTLCRTYPHMGQGARPARHS